MTQVVPLPDLLATWQDRVAVCGTNLVDLQQAREFARLKAKAAQNRLGEESARLAGRMVEDMAALWSLWQALRQVVEAAAAESARGMLWSDPAEVRRLLTQASVDCGTVRIDSKVRGAFQAGAQREMLSPDEAAERIETLTARIQQGIADARTGWEARTQKAAYLDAAAREMLVRAEAVGEGQSVAEAEALVAAVHATVLTTEDDPIGASQALEAVRVALDRVRVQVAVVEDAARAAQAGLVLAGEAMARLREDRKRHEDAHARAAERIDVASGVGPLPGRAEVANLEGWLGRLRDLPTGRIAAITAGLKAWNAALGPATARERQSYEALAGLLRTRKDLREQYEMLVATADDLAGAGQPDRATRLAHSEARSLLLHRPMSIPDATAAVRAFENEILARTANSPAGEDGR